MNESNAEFEITTEFTPNPHSLKFNLNTTLMESGSAFFATQEEAVYSPLAQLLLNIENVESVFFGSNFVTITRNASIETWAGIIPFVSKTIRQFLASGEKVMDVNAHAQAQQAITRSDIEQKIIQVLDEYIRPAVARDGGDIVFHGFKNGIVTLHLQGACSTCPSSIATLKSGVERMLKEHVPEVKEVLQTG